MLLFISNKKKFRKLKSYIDHVALFQLLTATCNNRYQRMLQIRAPDKFFLYEQFLSMVERNTKTFVHAYHMANITS